MINCKQCGHWHGNSINAHTRTKIADGIYTYLAPAEVKELRAACRYASLSFRAMAARPGQARKLIKDVEAEQEGP